MIVAQENTSVPKKVLIGKIFALPNGHYYPFGKESRSSASVNKPREQFTGKERDLESGLDYFGARYYNAEIARWISVDALSGKYPSLTPYNYAANNPVFFVDPNGLDLIFSGDKSAIDAAVGIINKHLEGSGLSVAASYSGAGAYIDFAGQAGNLSESQQALVSVLAGAMFATTGADGQGDKYDVNIGVVENSANITLSSFDASIVDVGDILLGFGGSEAITPAVVLGHEVKEQTVGQNPDFIKANPNMDKRYEKAHDQAVKAEEKIGGYKQDRKNSGNVKKGNQLDMVTSVKKDGKKIKRTVSFEEGQVIETREEK
jgi:RHS repeat-associated protein